MKYPSRFIILFVGAQLCFAVAAGPQNSPAAPSAGTLKTVSPLDFGAKGDCVADDTAALLKMRDALLAIQAADPTNTVSFQIESPAGRCYQYTSNRWTWGLKRLRLVFHGSSIKNVNNSKWGEDNKPFSSNRSAFATQGYDAQPFSSPLTQGFLIETAAPGAISVKLRNPDDARNFHPGAWVLLYSYDQQFDGFPPNARYYDFARVGSISGGVISLDRTLTGEHREDYPELTSNRNHCGRARILPLDRDIPFAESLEVDGIRALPNPNNEKPESSYFLVVNTYRVVITNSDLVSFVPSEVHEAIVRNSSIYYTEPDKLIDHLRFENCDIQHTSGASGVKQLEIEGGKIHGMLFFNPRELKIENVTLAGAAGAPPNYGAIGGNIFFAPTRSITIQSSQFTGTGTLKDRLVADPRAFPLKIDASGIRVDGRGLVSAPISLPATQHFLGCAEPGKPITVSGERDSADAFQATVADIRGDTVNAYVQISATRPLESGDTLNCTPITHMSFAHNQYSDFAFTSPTEVSQRPLLPKWVAVDFETQTQQAGKLQTLTLDSTHTLGQTLAIEGYIDRIEVNVTKPYAGPGPGAFLNILATKPVYGSLKESVDVSALGLRRITPSAGTASQRGDVLVPLPSKYVDEIRVYFSPTSMGAAAQFGGSGQGEVVQLSIHTRKP